MGKDLHLLIRQFVEEKILNHNMVESYQDISDDDYYMYKLSRKNGMIDVDVLLDDNYHFGDIALAEALGRLPNGGIILIPRPESTIVVDNVPISDQNIYVAKIGLVMGCLYKNNYWEYVKPKKKETKE